MPELRTLSLSRHADYHFPPAPDLKHDGKRAHTINGKYTIRGFSTNAEQRSTLLPPRQNARPQSLALSISNTAWGTPRTPANPKHPIMDDKNKDAGSPSSGNGSEFEWDATRWGEQLTEASQWEAVPSLEKIHMPEIIATVSNENAARPVQTVTLSMAEASMAPARTERAPTLDSAAVAFIRSYCEPPVTDLLNAYETGDRTRIAKSLVALYRFDRESGSPHRSGVERWLSVIEALPEFTRQELRNVLGLVDWQAVQNEQLHDEISIPCDILSNVMLEFILAPGGVFPTSTRNTWNSTSIYSMDDSKRDKLNFLMGLAKATAVLDGSASIDEPARPAHAEEVDIFQDMAPPRRPGILSRTVRRIRSYFPWSTRYRAERKIFDVVKLQAKGMQLGKREWTSLIQAIQDLQKLSNGHALYERAVQDCLAELNSQECATIKWYMKLPNKMSADPTVRQYLADLDNALAREPAARIAVGIVQDFLQAPSKDLAFNQAKALQHLWAVLDEHASEDTPSQLAICRAATDRLRGQSRRIRKAAKSFETPAGRKSVKDGIHQALRRNMSNDNARDHVLRLMPVLRALAAVLQEKRLYP